MQTARPEPSVQHCQRCVQHKLNCKGGGPEAGNCKKCSKAGSNCVWDLTAFENQELQKRLTAFENQELEKRLTAFENQELEKRRRALSSDGGDDRTPEKKTRQVKGACKATKRFICPFFLRNPEHWRKNHSCSGDGWEDYHRLKEHIFRVHKLPVHCPRCSLKFTDATEVVHHLVQKGANLCQKVELPVELREGCDEAQEKRLRARKGVVQTPINQWREMWKILFREDPEEEIPDPYEYYSNRYVRSLDPVFSNLKDYATRPSSSITVEEIQEGIRKILQVLEPGLTFDTSSKTQSADPLPSSPMPILDNNPFRRGNNVLPVAQDSRTTIGGPAVSDGPETALPMRESFPLLANQSTIEERPCEKWYRERRGIDRGVTSTMAAATLPISHLPYLQIPQPAISMEPITYDTIDPNATTCSYQDSELLDYSSGPVATESLQQFRTNQHHVPASLSSFLHGTQTQLMVPNLALVNQQDLTRYPWSSSNIYQI